MAVRIGSLIATLKLQSDQFLAEAKRANRELGAMRKSLDLVKGAMLGAFAAAGINASAQGLRSIAEGMAATTNKANQLNIAVERLQELQFAAEQTGGSANVMNMALQRMTRRISEAAGGSGEAVKALKELRLDAEKLNDLDPFNQARAVADALAQNIGNAADQQRLLIKLVDSEGAILVNLFRQGSQAIDSYAEEAQKAGLVFSTELGEKAIANVDRLNKELGRLKSVLRPIAADATEFAANLAGAAASLGDLKAGRMTTTDRLRAIRESQPIDMTPTGHPTQMIEEIITGLLFAKRRIDEGAQPLKRQAREATQIAKESASSRRIEAATKVEAGTLLGLLPTEGIVSVVSRLRDNAAALAAMASTGLSRGIEVNSLNARIDRLQNQQIQSPRVFAGQQATGENLARRQLEHTLQLTHQREKTERQQQIDLLTQIRDALLRGTRAPSFDFIPG